LEKNKGWNVGKSQLGPTKVGALHLPPFGFTNTVMPNKTCDKK